MKNKEKEHKIKEQGEKEEKESSVSQTKKDDNTISLTKEEVEAMNKKINEETDKALRAQADLINYRKRKDEEVSAMMKYANETLILEILPILDNFERAIKANNEDGKFFEGVKMIYESLNKTLKNYGVTEIDAINKTFDATYHQAVATESDDKKQKDTITEVYQKGYMLYDKVLRPAMVKVNK